jgi:transcriptional regulator with XRE-family HTH domain
MWREAAMLMSDLQNQLRILVRERIAAGELTGTELARRAGFQQAHVSNFLNGRRGFSIETMDRVMAVMRLEVSDLMPELRSTRAAAERGEAGFESIPLVEAPALLHRQFSSDEIVEFLHFKKSFLRRIRSAMENERGDWQRFVLMKADKDSGAAMSPRLAPGATLLIDRHYNSLRSYRRGEPNIYVVKSGEAWPVRYVELQGSQLTLRPENQESALGAVQLGRGETFADYVVGRVAHIAMET